MGRGRVVLFLRDLVERLMATAASSIAAQAETEAAISEVDCLDRIEAAAQRYEEQDKPHLAERLRQRAGSLNLDSPGASGIPLLADQTSESNDPPPPAPRASRRRRSSGEREE